MQSFNKSPFIPNFTVTAARIHLRNITESAEAVGVQRLRRNDKQQVHQRFNSSLEFNTILYMLKWR